MYDGRTPTHKLWHAIFLCVFVSFIYNNTKIHPGVTHPEKILMFLTPSKKIF